MYSRVVQGHGGVPRQGREAGVHRAQVLLQYTPWLHHSATLHPHGLRSTDEVLGWCGRTALGSGPLPGLGSLPLSRNPAQSCHCSSRNLTREASARRTESG